MDIKINVKAAKDPRDIDVKLQGSEKKLISNKDQEIFQISEKRVKKAIKKLNKEEKESKNVKPTGVVATCHKPFGNLIASCNMLDVLRKLEPVKWEIIRTHTETNVVASRKLVNNTDKAGIYNVGLKFNDYHTIKRTKKLEFDSNIDYTVSLPVATTSSISYQTYEENFYKSVPFGSHLSVEVELEPGAERVVNLHVTRCVNELKVIFKASLEGVIASKIIEFLKWYRKNYCVNNVLEAAELPITVMTSEVLKISFFTHGEIMITEK